MKKWILSAIVYLLVVVGGYIAVTSGPGPDDKPDHSNTDQHNK